MAGGRCRQRSAAQTVAGDENVSERRVRLWNPCQTGARRDGFACIALARHGPTTHDGLMIERERSTVQSAPLDDVSKSIIEQLQEDGRRPYATIAAAVGLSEAAVRQRVQRLLKSGVIQIVAVTERYIRAIMSTQDNPGWTVADVRARSHATTAA